MTNPKEVVSETPAEVTASEGGEAKSVAVETKPAAESAPAPAVPRKAPGTKEVIPFEWKLIGDAGGLVLTLFKAVERDEVEAQMERLQRDDYYKNLRILGNLEKVKQPRATVSAIPVRKGERPKAAKKAAGRAKKSAGKSDSAARKPKAKEASAAKKSSKAPPSRKGSKRTESTKSAKATKSVKRAKAKKPVKAAKAAKATKASASAKKTKAVRGKTTKKSSAKAKSTKKRTPKKK